MEYKTQFAEGATEDQVQKAKMAAYILLQRFEPLLKKYCNLIRSGHINYADKEMKHFVHLFLGDPALKTAIKRRFSTLENCAEINKRFDFVIETYGRLSEEIIMTDLQMLFLVLAKRYKPMGKNFCAYIYNSYCFEVSRHIKKFISNPANIPYRTVEYEEWQKEEEWGAPDKCLEECLEDKAYENSQGIPDIKWILGEGCSHVFQSLTPEERKLIIKYYLEDYNDRQIAGLLGMHINTVNQKRRKAVIKLANAIGVNVSKIKRNRKSGKKALLPH